MHRQTFSMLDTSSTTCEVTFDHATTPGQIPRLYTYKVHKSTALAVGDLVVVPGHPFTIARVMVVHETAQIDPDFSGKYVWIVQKIDTTTYDACLAREEAFELHRRKVETENARRALLDSLPPEVSNFFLEAPAQGSTIRPVDEAECGPLDHG